MIRVFVNQRGTARYCKLRLQLTGKDLEVHAEIALHAIDKFLAVVGYPTCFGCNQA